MIKNLHQLIEEQLDELIYVHKNILHELEHTKNNIKNKETIKTHILLLNSLTEEIKDLKTTVENLTKLYWD